MTPAVDDNVPPVQSSVPLLSRRRGSLSNSSSSVKNDSSSSDLELGGSGLEDSDCAISFRVKTAGDGREYSVSSTLTSTVAQVCLTGLFFCGNGCTRCLVISEGKCRHLFLDLVSTCNTSYIRSNFPQSRWQVVPRLPDVLTCPSHHYCLQHSIPETGINTETFVASGVPWVGLTLDRLGTFVLILGANKQSA